MYKKTLLIDGDVLLYKAAFACQKKVLVIDADGTEQVELDIIDAQEGYTNIDNTVRYLKFNLKPSKVVVYLSNEDKLTHHRYQLEGLAKPYKGNRPPKPVRYKEMRNYLMRKYKAIVSHCGEADDILGIEQTSDTVICSIDKDLLQIAGLHWNIAKGIAIKVLAPGELNLFYRVKPDGRKQAEIYGTGFKWFCAQMIMGDTVDNIPGIPRQGAVAAYKALADCETEQDCWERIKRCYLAVDLSKEYFIQHCYLLWIAREDGRTMPHYSMGEACEC